MVLKNEMENENQALTKKVKRLENKIKKLKSKLDEANSMDDFRVQMQRRSYEETEKFKNKLFEREQQLDAQETKGPVFQVCDPSLQGLHKRRELGVDVYLERHLDDRKLLLTRIPINIDYETYDRMSFEERAATLEPLVRGLRYAYSKADEPIVHIEVSINEMYWTDE